MGVCASQKHSQYNNQLKTQIDQPLVTQGELSFKVLLKNIKLTVPTLRQCSIQFEILQNTYLSPNHISIEGIHFWRASYETTIKITEAEMKSTFVQITVLSPTPVGSAKLNLFEVAVGPWHFDFPIISATQKKVGRVQFDLKLSQIVQASIETSLINIEMNTSISDVGYNYNLRLVTSHLSFISEHSETYVNPNFRKRGFQTMKSGLFSRKSLVDSQSSLNDASTPVNKQQSYVSELHTVEWDHSEEKETSVKLILELPITELLISAIQLCIWSVQSLPKFSSNKMIPRTQKVKINLQKHDSEYADLQIQDHHLVAETYISLAHLYDNLQVELGNKRFITVSCAHPKQIWYHGVEVGKSKYNLNVIVPHYLQQTSLGCQTESGIIQQIQVVGQLEQISVQEIQQINQEFQKLSSTIFKLEPKKLQVKEKLQLRYEAELSLAKLEKLLNLTHNDTVKIFQYKSDEDLFKAQELFIQLSEHLIEYSDTLEGISSAQYYKNLNGVLQRGELMLAQIGFFKDLNKKQVTIKENICVKFQTFLINTLKIILARMNHKDPNKDARIFITKYLVIAYFRIPQFRVKFLESITNADDPPLSETRGTEFIQEDDPTNIDKSTKQNIQVFDWQNYFHVYIQDNPKAIANQNVLNSILNDDTWKEIMKHRSMNFCFFVEEWAKYVRAIISQKMIPWSDIPGYRTLTKAFMCELKQQEQFTDAMKNALQSLMQNPNLLSIVVNLLYNKTNLYNSENVIETLDMFNICFTSLQNMPNYFDYPFFLKGLKQIIFDSEHAICLAKAIWFLYNNYLLFPLEFKKDICEFLFEKVVFKLYLHWSKTVRTIFHNFIIYRIYHLHKNPHHSQQDEDQLMSLYTVMARPKKQQSYFENRQQQNQLISDYIYIKYMRFLAKIESAKNAENQKEYEGDPKSLYTRMVQKKIKLQRQGLADQHSEEEKVKKQASTPIMKLEQFGEPDEILTKTTEPIIVPRPILHKKINYKYNTEITENQLKYVLTSYHEYEEIMKQYNNWRQQKMKAIISKTKLTDEEKSTIHLTFEVPQLSVLKKIDEKEGI